MGKKQTVGVDISDMEATLGSSKKSKIDISDMESELGTSKDRISFEYNPIATPKGYVDHDKLYEILKPVDASDSEKEYIIDMAKKGASVPEVSDAILTIQGKHPKQEGNMKYYLEDTANGYKKPVPMKADEAVPYGKEMNNIWGQTQESVDEDGRLTDILKKAYNVLPKIGESAADLGQAIYGAITDDEASWYQPLKNASKDLQMKTASKYEKGVLDTGKFKNWSDYLESENYDFTPETIANTFTDVGQSILQFALTRKGFGAASSKAENLAKGFTSSYVVNFPEALDAANAAGVKGRDAYLTALSATVPIAILDVIGGGEGAINKAFEKQTGKSLVGNLVKGAVKDADGNITKEALDDLYHSAFAAGETVAKNTDKSLLRTAAEESFQEVGQNLIQKTSQVIHDNLVADNVEKYGTELFTPEAVAEYLNDAFGGFLGGAQGHVVSGQHKDKEGEQSKSIMDAIAKGTSGINELKAQLVAAQKSGDISMNDVDKAMFKIDRYKEYHEATKGRDISDEAKRKVFDLTYQKANLQAGIEHLEKNNVDGINDGLIKIKQTQIKDYDKQIEELWAKKVVPEDNLASQELKTKVSETEKGKAGEAKPITKVTGPVKSEAAPAKPLQRKVYEAKEKLSKEKFNALDEEDKFHYVYDKLKEGQSVKGKVWQQENSDNFYVEFDNGKRVKIASSSLSTGKHAKKEAITPGMEVTISPSISQGYKTLEVKKGENKIGFVAQTVKGMGKSKYSQEELFHPSKQIKMDEGAATWNQGVLEGQEETPEMKEKVNELIRKGDTPIEGGESFNQFRDRAINWFKEKLQNAKDKSVVVTHSQMLKVIDAWEKAGRPDDYSKINPEDIIKENVKSAAVKEFKTPQGVMYVVRHGDTTQNKGVKGTPNLLRTKDVKLAKKGIEEAEKIGEELKGKDVSEISSSPLERAYQTAQIIRKKIHEKPSKPEVEAKTETPKETRKESVKEEAKPVEKAPVKAEPVAKKEPAKPSVTYSSLKGEAFKQPGHSVSFAMGKSLIQAIQDKKITTEEGQAIFDEWKKRKAYSGEPNLSDKYAENLQKEIDKLSKLTKISEKPTTTPTPKVDVEPTKEQEKANKAEAKDSKESDKTELLQTKAAGQLIGNTDARVQEMKNKVNQLYTGVEGFNNDAEIESYLMALASQEVFQKDPYSSIEDLLEQGEKENNERKINLAKRLQSLPDGDVISLFALFRSTVPQVYIHGYTNQRGQFDLRFSNSKAGDRFRLLVTDKMGALTDKEFNDKVAAFKRQAVVNKQAIKNAPTPAAKIEAAKAAIDFQFKAAEDLTGIPADIWMSYYPLTLSQADKKAFAEAKNVYQFYATRPERMTPIEMNVFGTYEKMGLKTKEDIIKHITEDKKGKGSVINTLMLNKIIQPKDATQVSMAFTNPAGDKKASTTLSSHFTIRASQMSKEEGKDNEFVNFNKKEGKLDTKYVSGIIDKTTNESATAGTMADGDIIKVLAKEYLDGGDSYYQLIAQAGDKEVLALVRAPKHDNPQAVLSKYATEDDINHIKNQFESLDDLTKAQMVALFNGDRAKMEKFFMNFAANFIEANIWLNGSMEDYMKGGKVNYAEIIKRNASTFSPGIAGNKYVEGGMGESIPMAIINGGKIDVDLPNGQVIKGFKVGDGGSFITREWMDKINKSFGTSFNFNTSIKAITSYVVNGRRFLDKTNSVAIDDIAQAQLEQSGIEGTIDNVKITPENINKLQYVAMYQFMKRNGIGKLSTAEGTKKTAGTPIINLFEEGKGKMNHAIFEADAKPNIVQVPTDNYLVQQDLMADDGGRLHEGSTPTQLTKNIMFHPVAQFIAEMNNEIAAKRIKQIREEAVDNKNIRGYLLSRLGITDEDLLTAADEMAEVEKITLDESDDIKRLLKNGTSLLDPALNKYVQTMIAHVVTNKALGKVSNKALAVELGNYGLSLRDYRKKGDKLLLGEVAVPASTGLRLPKVFKGSKEEAIKYIKKHPDKFLDLFSWDDKTNSLGELNDYEIEETEGGVIIPGELVLYTRIPADDLHSHTLARVKMHLPKEFKNHIVTPLGVQAIAGSDNDGDQRTMQALFKESKMVKDKKVRRFVTGKQSTEGISNIAFLAQARIFRDQKLLNDLVAPIDTSFADDLVKFFDKGKKMVWGGITDLMAARTKNTVGLNVVGAMANMQAIYDFLKAHDSVLKNPISFPSLSKEGEIKGEQSFKEYKKDMGIKHVIGNLLNMALDNVKDPKIETLGLNEQTVNAYVGALMLGSDLESVATFFNHPVVKEYVAEMRKQKLSFNTLTKDEAILNLMTRIDADKKVLNSVITPGQMMAIQKIQKDEKLTDSQRTEQINKIVYSTYFAGIEGKDVKVTEADFKNPKSAAVLMKLMQLNGIANDYNTIHSVIRTTEKAPKTYADYYNASAKYDNVINNRLPFIDVANFKDSPFIKPADLNLKNVSRQMLERFSIQGSKLGRHLANKFTAAKRKIKSNDEIYLSRPEIKALCDAIEKVFYSISRTKGLTVQQVRNKTINDVQGLKRQDKYKAFTDMLEILAEPNSKVQIREDLKVGQMDDIQLKEARDAFDELFKDEPAIANNFLDYLTFEYGFSSSRYGGSFVSLLSDNIRKEYGKTLEKAKERYFDKQPPDDVVDAIIADIVKNNPILTFAKGAYDMQKNNDSAKIYQPFTIEEKKEKFSTPEEFDTGTQISFSPGMSEEDAVRAVYEESTNPAEIAATYVREMAKDKVDMSGDTDYSIYSFFKGNVNKIDRASLERAWDKNAMDTGILKQYAPKESEGGIKASKRKLIPGQEIKSRKVAGKKHHTVDSALESINQEGAKVGVEDLIDFMRRHPNGYTDYETNISKKTKEAGYLEERFEIITGKKLNPALALDIVAATKKKGIVYQKVAEGAGDESLLNKVVDYLKKANPKLKIKYDPSLKFAGQAEGDGTITINPHYAKTDTPIHEIGHILIDSIGGTSNRIVAKAIEQLKGTTLWKETLERYPELSEDMLGKEVLAEAIGREGAGIFEEQSAKSKFRQLLDYIFDRIKQVLGLDKNIAKSLAKRVISGGVKPAKGAVTQLKKASQGDIVNSLTGVREKVKFNEEEHAYYVDGKKIGRSVTEAIGQTPGYEFLGDTEKYKINRDMGTDLGKIAEDIVNKVKPAQTMKAMKTIKDKAVFDNAHAQIKDFLRKLSYDGVVLTEQPLVSVENDVAGKADIIVVRRDGSIDVYDFKSSTKSTQFGSDARNYRKGSYFGKKPKERTHALQVATYGNILENGDDATGLPPQEINTINIIPIKVILEGEEMKGAEIEQLISFNYNRERAEAMKILPNQRVATVENQYKEEKSYFANAGNMSKNTFAKYYLGYDLVADQVAAKTLGAQLSEASAEEKAEIQERLDAIKMRSQEAEVAYKEWKQEVSRVKEALKQEPHLDKMSDEELIDLYNTLITFDDTTTSAYFNDIRYRIGQVLSDRQADYLRAKHPNLDLENAKFKDIMSKDIYMKALSDMPEFTPDLQALSKMWDEADFNMKKEQYEFINKLNELGLEVIKEQSKDLSVKEKAKLSVVGDNSQFFKWMNDNGELLSVAKAKKMGLSEAQIKYLEFYREIKSHFAPQQNKMEKGFEDNGLVMIDKSFHETWRDQGFMAALQMKLGGRTSINEVKMYYDKDLLTLDEINGKLQKEAERGVLTKVGAAAKSTYYAVKAKKLMAEKRNEDGSKLDERHYAQYTINRYGYLTNKFGYKRDEKRGFSEDFHAAMLQYIDHMTFTKHVSPIVPYVESVEYFNSVKKNGKEAKQNVAQWMKYWKQLHIYKEEPASRFPGLDLTMKTLRTLTSMIGMTFNFNAGKWNTIIGNYNSYREVGAKLWTKGQKRLFTIDPTNKKYFIDPKAKAILKEFDVVSTEPDYNPRKSIGKMFSGMATMFTKAGEFQIQGSMFFGLLSDEDWNNIDEEGKYVGKDKEAFMKRVQAHKNKISSIQGKYNDKDRRNYELFELGRFIGQFKVWTIDWMKERFGQKFITRDGEVHYGSWQVFTQKAFSELWQDMKTKEFWTGDSYESKRMRQNLQGALVVASLLAIKLGADDDDEKRKKGDELSQAISNLVYIFDPQQLAFTIATPAAGLKTAKDFVTAFGDAITLEEYKKSGRYGDAGDLKAPGEFARILPYRNLVMNDYFFGDEE